MLLCVICMAVVVENIVCCSELVGVTNGDSAACTGDTSFTMHPAPTHTLTFFSFSSLDFGVRGLVLESAILGRSLGSNCCSQTGNAFMQKWVTGPWNRVLNI